MTTSPTLRALFLRGMFALALPLSAGLTASAAHAAPLASGDAAPQCASVIEEMEATCCPTPKGCVRTQGYWGNKPDVVWPKPYSRTRYFFSLTVTWQGILDTAPAGGNGYIILAHQYIAAVLNRAAGASVPSAVQTVIDQATAWFNSGATPDDCGGSACQTQKEWARILDSYNNGTYSGGPASCKD